MLFIHLFSEKIHSINKNKSPTIHNKISRIEDSDRITNIYIKGKNENSSNSSGTIVKVPKERSASTAEKRIF